MKTFKQFLKETPTNHGNSAGTQGGFGQAATDSGPVAGYDKKIWNYALSQDYQTPGESGQAKWRFSNIYPVMRLTLSNSDGDGPSIDQMVYASKEYVQLMDDKTIARIRKHFSQVREGWSAKYKRSIDCSNPKGFSQKAHCAGRKKRAK
tara:strand:- start:30 stop:476 length:447 start_codon:yes stop_codon:yes gene_type:complete